MVPSASTVRRALPASNCSRAATPAEFLDAESESVLVNSLQHTDHGSYLAMDPTQADRLLRSIQSQMERFESSTTQPVLLASPAIRGHLRKFTERFIPQLAILSHNEVAPGVRIQSLGTVSVS